MIFFWLTLVDLISLVSDTDVEKNLFLMKNQSSRDVIF